MSPSPYVSPTPLKVNRINLNHQENNSRILHTDSPATANINHSSPSSTSSPAQIVAALKATPKGKLTYDRGGDISSSYSRGRGNDNESILSSSPPDRSSPSLSPSSLASLSPPLLTSQLSQNASFQSVLEEVALEMEQVKMEEVAQVASKINKNILARGKEVKVTLGPNAEADQEEEERVEVVEEEIIPVKTYLCGSPAKQAEHSPVVTPKVTKMSPDAVTSVTSPVSPVDEELRQLDRDMNNQLEAKKGRRTQQVLQKLRELRTKNAEQKKERMKAIHREAKESEDRLEQEAEKAKEQEKIMQIRMQNEAKKKAEERQASLKVLQEKEEERRRVVAAEMSKVKLVLQKAEAASTEGIETTAACAEFKLAVEQAKAVLAAEDAAKSNAVVATIEKGLAAVIMEKGRHEKQLEEKRKLEAEEEKRKKREEAAALLAQKEEELRKLQEQQEKAKAALASKPEVPAAATTMAPVTGEAAFLQECSARNKQRFEELHVFKEEWRSKLEAFKQDSNIKSFRFACQKAVNTPVNAISAVSADHLKDKLSKLRSLLAGETVEVSGKSHRASDHPMGIEYCTELMAKKFVSQGDEVVSSKPEYAFSMATALVSLWVEFPALGKLFLAYLFEACPYLVPCNFAKRQGEVDEAHYKRLGYRYDDDGKVEEQTKYIKRISGLARLYAAVSTSHLPHQIAEKTDHPHGIGYIWSWLASVLNLQPVNDVTATLIHDVLNVAGHHMCLTYKGVFAKMLLVLKDEYFPKIQQVTLQGSSGPVARLEEFLKRCSVEIVSEARAIQKPAKELPPDFL